MATPKTAPHRRRDSTFLLAAFALQIPVLITMKICGVSPEWTPVVLLLPATTLALTSISRTQRL